MVHTFLNPLLRWPRKTFTYTVVTENRVASGNDTVNSDRTMLDLLQLRSVSRDYVFGLWF